jgi:hypothetical protein
MRTYISAAFAAIALLAAMQPAQAWHCRNPRTRLSVRMECHRFSNGVERCEQIMECVLKHKAPIARRGG